jgi:Flp pilus assembly protein TadD
MIRGRSQAAVQAFKEAVKFKRNSWEVWDNYSKVLLDTGSIQQVSCVLMSKTQFIFLS